MEKKSGDFDQQLDQITQEMTAADLIRKRGQHTKLKTISQKDLRNLIERFVDKELAGRADTFSDAEREQMARQIQEQFSKNVEAAQSRAKDEQRRAAELAQQIEQLKTSAQGDQARLQHELESLYQAKLSDLQNQLGERDQDILLLEDNLDELEQHRNATLEEKRRLQETNREFLMRSNSLTQVALQIDEEYYSGAHRQSYEAQHGDEDQEDVLQNFYQDFEIATSTMEDVRNHLVPIQEAAAEAEAEEQAPPPTTLPAMVDVVSEGGIKTEQLRVLYRATDDCMARLSGHDPAIDPEIPTGRAGIAELERRIESLRNGIAQQANELNEAQAKAAQVGPLEQQLLEARAAQRELASTLAAAAVPVDGESPVDDGLAEAVADLELSLAEEETEQGDDQINVGGGKVVAALVASRKALEDRAQKAEHDAQLGLTTCRTIAADLVQVGVEGSDKPVDQAAFQLQQDLDLEHDGAMDHEQAMNALRDQCATLSALIAEERARAEQEIAEDSAKIAEIEEQVAAREQTLHEMEDQLSGVRGTNRELAQSLAAAALPVVQDAGTDAEELAHAVADLEISLENDEESEDPELASKGQAVIGALLADRRRLNSEADAAENRANAAESALMALSHTISDQAESDPVEDIAEIRRQVRGEMDVVEDTDIRTDDAITNLSAKGSEAVKAILQDRSTLRGKIDAANEAGLHLAENLAATAVPMDSEGVNENLTQAVAGLESAIGDDNDAATLAARSNLVIASMVKDRQRLTGELERAKARIEIGEGTAKEFAVELITDLDCGDDEALATKAETLQQDLDLMQDGNLPEEENPMEAVRVSGVETIRALKARAASLQESLDETAVQAEVSGGLLEEERQSKDEAQKELAEIQQKLQEVSDNAERYREQAEASKGAYRQLSETLAAAAIPVGTEADETLKAQVADLEESLANDESDVAAGADHGAQVVAGMVAQQRRSSEDLAQAKERQQKAEEGLRELAEALATAKTGKGDIIDEQAEALQQEIDLAADESAVPEEANAALLEQGTALVESLIAARASLSAEVDRNISEIGELQERAGALEGRAQSAEGANRQLAETLAAVAVPVDGSDESGQETEVATAAAGLEQELQPSDGEQPVSAEIIAGKGADVIAAMVSERRRAAAEIATLNQQKTSAEDNCKQLAQALAASAEFGLAQEDEVDQPLAEAIASLNEQIGGNQDGNTEGDAFKPSDVASGAANVIQVLKADRQKLRDAIEEAEIRTEAAESIAEEVKGKVEELEHAVAHESQRADKAQEEAAGESGRADTAEDANRQLAEVLAAAAIPLPGQEASDNEAMGAAVAELEAALEGSVADSDDAFAEADAQAEAEGDSATRTLDSGAVAERGAAVVAALIAERRTMAEKLNGAKTRVEAAEVNCRRMAETLAEQDAEDLKPNEDLANALSALQHELDLSEDEMVDANEAMGGLTDSGCQVIEAMKAQCTALQKAAGYKEGRIEELERDLAENAKSLAEAQGSLDGERGRAAELDQTNRQFAETLAAAAIPMDASEVDEGLQNAVSELEASIVDEDPSTQDLVERSNGVIAAMVSDRRKLAEDLSKERSRADAATASAKDLARALSTSVNPGEQTLTNGLAEAADQLGQDLDLADEGHTDAAEASRNIAEQGQDLIGRLTDERFKLGKALEQATDERDRLKEEAEQQAEAIKAAETAGKRLAKALTKAALPGSASLEDDRERQVQDAVNALSQHIDTDGDDIGIEADAEGIESDGNDIDDPLLDTEMAVVDALVNERDSLLWELADLKTQKTSFEGALAEAKGRADAAESDAQALAAVGQELSGTLEEMARENAEISRELFDEERSNSLGGLTDQLNQHRGQSDAGDMDGLIHAGRQLGDELRQRNQELVARLKEANARGQDLDGQLESTRADVANLGQELDGARTDIDRLNGELAAEKEALKASNDRLSDNLADLDMAKAEIESIEGELSDEREKFRQASARIDEFEARTGATSAGVSEELAEVRQQLENEVDRHQVAMRDLNGQLEDREEAMAALKIRIDELESRRHKAEDEIRELQEELNENAEGRVSVSDLQAKIDALEEENQQLKEIQKEAIGGSGQLAQIKEELSKERSRIDRMRSERSELETELAEAKAKNEGAAARLTKERESLQAEIDEWKTRAKDSESRERNTREEFNAVKADAAGVKARLRSLTDAGDEPIDDGNI